MYYNNNMKMNGFSLIELMVVIAIVAILAAVAVPLYKKNIIQSEVVVALQGVESVKKAAIMFYDTNGTFTGMTFDDICGDAAIINSGTACDASNVSNLTAVGMAIAPDGTAMRLNVLFVDGYADHDVGGNTIPRVFIGLKQVDGIMNTACGYRSDNTALALDEDFRPASCNTDIFTYVGI